MSGTEMSEQQILAMNCLDKMKACRRDLKHILDKGSSGCELGLLNLRSAITKLDGAILSLSEAI